MSNEITISPEQIIKGVHVRIPLGWTDHPFLFSSFVVTTDEQVAQLKALGTKFACDLSRCKVPPLPLPSTAPKEPLRIDPERVKEQEAQLEQKRERMKVMNEIRSRLDVVQKEFNAAAEHASRAFGSFRANPAQSVETLRKVSSESSSRLLTDTDSALVLITDKARNENGVAHALSVMTLSLMLAKQLNLPESLASAIGMGALVHDIGKAGINPSILRNPDRNRHEEEIYRMHCQKGVEEIFADRSVAIPRVVLDIIQYHHEHADGSGFPGQLTLEKIPLTAKVVAIANRFDNLTNPADSRRAVAPSEALGLMWSHEKSHFDNMLLQAFVRAMGVYPPGSIVLLNNQRIGVVVRAAPDSARLSPQVMLYDPDIPRREALIYDLADPRIAAEIRIEKSLRLNERPEEELDYLLPRRKLSWFASGKAG